MDKNLESAVLELLRAAKTIVRLRTSRKDPRSPSPHYALLQDAIAKTERQLSLAHYGMCKDCPHALADHGPYACHVEGCPCGD